MSKKNTVLAFVANLPEGTTSEDAFKQFESLHPGLVRKGDFNHYLRNELSHYLAKAESGANDDGIVRNHVDSKYVRMTDVEHEIDPIILKPMPTGTAFDSLISKRGGALRSCVVMITGESGAGKTTVCTNIADYIEEQDQDTKTGFISGEMELVDWYEECSDNPRLKRLETIFLLDYIDASNYMTVLEEALSKWDYCILDSFQVVVEQIQEVLGISSKKAETKLIALMRRIAKDHNVCIFCINQYSKSGTYVGSTKIKHLTTAMIFVLFDKNGERYLIFTKNRRNGHAVGKRLYFTKDKATGRILFDAERLATQEWTATQKAEDKAKLQEESQKFDDMIRMLQDSKFVNDVNNADDNGTEVPVVIEEEEETEEA